MDKVENVNDGVLETEKPVETKEEAKEPEKKEGHSPLFEKVLKEKKNAMTRVRELESKLEEANNLRLKEKEDYKTLYEQERVKREALEGDFQKEQAEKINGFKLSSLKRELSKMGADDNSIDLLLKIADKEAMKYDTDHKVVLGAESVAQQLKEQAPKLFGGPNVGVDQRAPDTKFSTIDVDSFKKLDAKDKSNPDILRQLYEKHGIKVRE